MRLRRAMECCLLSMDDIAQSLNTDSFIRDGMTSAKQLRARKKFKAVAKRCNKLPKSQRKGCFRTAYRK